MSNGKKKPDELVRQDLIVEMDLSELGFGKTKIDYDPAKPGEKEAADRLINDLQQMIKDRTVSVPVAQPLSNPSATAVSAMVDEFLSPGEVARRKDKPATLRKDRDALTLFVELVTGPSMPMQDVKQQHAVDFSRALDARGLMPNTKNNHMSSVSKFSEWVAGSRPAVVHTALSFKTLRFKQEARDDEQRAAFTDEEVKRTSYCTRICKRSSEKSRTSSGCLGSRHIPECVLKRSRSLILRLTCDRGRVWVFDVNQANGKQLKNKWSKRLVPIHPALWSVGLRAYLESLKIRRATRLFPDTPKFEGRVGKNAGKAANRFIQQTVGVQGKTLHCFRHTVATKLKGVLVEEAIAAALLGQKHGGVAYTRYGKDHPTQVVASQCMQWSWWRCPVS